MSYYIQRQQNQYGPYSLAELQTYLSQGSILWTDLGRTDAMTNWVPVSQLVNLVVPPAGVPPPASAAVAGAAAPPAAAQVPHVYHAVPGAVLPPHTSPRPQKTNQAIGPLANFLRTL